jgi:hypothetical protein
MGIDLRALPATFPTFFTALLAAFLAFLAVDDLALRTISRSHYDPAYGIA